MICVTPCFFALNFFHALVFKSSHLILCEGLGANSCVSRLQCWSNSSTRQTQIIISRDLVVLSKRKFLWIYQQNRWFAKCIVLANMINHRWFVQGSTDAINWCAAFWNFRSCWSAWIKQHIELLQTELGDVAIDPCFSGRDAVGQLVVWLWKLSTKIVIDVELMSGANCALNQNTEY